ncbi:hypothetical protein LMQ07_14765, partial [Staphylococcus aureus]|uniref:hypothetical protein n=1 Tax=Staphylococcus aureus TaxID=1280 RepID=UPI001E58F5F2
AAGLAGDKKDKEAGKETGAQAAAEAATDLERQRLAERMQKSAKEMRAAAGQDGKDNAAGKSAQNNAGTPTPGPAPEKDPRAQVSA